MIRKSAAVGLVALTSLLAGSASSAAPKKIDLLMYDYEFVPDHLIFVHGIRYRLHLENRGKETHEVTAPLFFAAAEIDNPNVLNSERSEIVVQPGQSKDLFLTARRPGTYDLRCADHDWNGMVGGITVK